MREGVFQTDARAIGDGRLSGDEERLLRRAHDDGRRAYGPLPVEFADFARGVLERTGRRLRARPGGPVAGDLAEALARVAGADVFLAVACDEGKEGAWEVFTREFVPRLRGLLRKYGAARDEADEIARDVAGDLASPPPAGGARTRMGTYDGAGSLFVWLGTVALRRLSDRARARKAAARTLPTEPETELVPAGERAAPDDPAASLDRTETGARLEGALASAWRALTPQEARAVIDRFRDGLPQRLIAGRLGVTESRVSRVVASAVEKIRLAVRSAFDDDRAGGPDSERLWAALRDAVARHMSNPSGRDDLLSTTPSSHE